jgi:tetratricopeptide (TPR) repeat protein
MDLEQWKARARQTRPGEEGELVTELAEELEQARAGGLGPAEEYQALWVLLPLARRAGQLVRLRRDVERASVLASDRPDPEILALASLRADVEQAEGRYQDAEATLRRALKRTADLDPSRKAAVLLKLGRLLVRRERYDQARVLLESVLPVLEAGGEPGQAATCLFHLGNLATWEHRLDQALELHERALVRRQEEGDLRGLCASLSALGAVSLAQGNYPRALAFYQDAESQALAADDESELAFALFGVGRTLFRLGDFSGAATRLKAVLEVRERTRETQGHAVAQVAMADTQLALGQLTASDRAAQEALFHLELHSPAAAVGDAERLLGRIRIAQKRSAPARQYLAKALVNHEKAADEDGAALDRSWLLRLALEWPVREEIEPITEALAAFLESHPYPETGEVLDLRLFEGLEALRRLGVTSERVAQRRTFLERAYRTLMRKTGYLQPAQRHRFLFQIPDHDAIVRAATAEGLV